jgi:hypothetical protein
MKLGDRSTSLVDNSKHDSIYLKRKCVRLAMVFSYGGMQLSCCAEDGRLILGRLRNCNQHHQDRNQQILLRE